jgi:DNA-directed RNA polymerase subunit M/transcription elongation factor TFIIS
VVDDMQQGMGDRDLTAVFVVCLECKRRWKTLQ